MRFKFLTLKLASISLKVLVFPLRAVQTRLNREENTQIRSKSVDKITFKHHFSLISNKWCRLWCFCDLLCWSSRSLSVIKIFSSFSSCKNSLSRSTSMSSTMLSMMRTRVRNYHITYNVLLLLSLFLSLQSLRFTFLISYLQMWNVSQSKWWPAKPAAPLLVNTPHWQKHSRCTIHNIDSVIMGSHTRGFFAVLCLLGLTIASVYFIFLFFLDLLICFISLKLRQSKTDPVD